MAAPRTTASKPTMVLFVRHGTTGTTGSILPGRAKGLHLADSGREQAERVAKRLADVGSVAAVYASPMERTRETAHPIARAVGKRVRVHAGLIEADFGSWTGRKLSQLRKLKAWTAVQRHPSGFRFPGGESFSEMQTRMVGAVRELCSHHPGETIVVVSHADTIKAAVADALGTHLDHFQRIVISPCSISSVVYGHDGTVVFNVNSSAGALSLQPS